MSADLDEIGYAVERLRSLGLTGDEINSDLVRDGIIEGRVIVVHRKPFHTAYMAVEPEMEMSTLMEILKLL